MSDQMVLVQEKGSRKNPIRIHSSNVQAGIEAGLYELRDPNWEMPGGNLRRKLHPETETAEPKRRRGRPPKQESVEVAESDD